MDLPLRQYGLLVHYDVQTHPDATPIQRHVTRRHEPEDRNPNIKIGLKGIGYEVVEWRNLSQDRNEWSAFVNTVMNFSDT